MFLVFVLRSTPNTYHSNIGIQIIVVFNLGTYAKTIFGMGEEYRFGCYSITFYNMTLCLISV